MYERAKPFGIVILCTMIGAWYGDLSVVVEPPPNSIPAENILVRRQVAVERAEKRAVYVPVGAITGAFVGIVLSRVFKFYRRSPE